MRFLQRRKRRKLAAVPDHIVRPAEHHEFDLREHDAAEHIHYVRGHYFECSCGDIHILSSVEYHDPHDHDGYGPAHDHRGPNYDIFADNLDLSDADYYARRDDYGRSSGD